VTRVAAGDGVAVVETDKSTSRIEQYDRGRLSGHLVAVGSGSSASTVAYVLKEGEVRTRSGSNAVVPVKVLLPVEAERR